MIALLGNITFSTLLLVYAGLMVVAGTRAARKQAAPHR